MHQLFCLLVVAHSVSAWNWNSLSEKRIINGTRANIKNHPFVVGIFKEKLGSWRFACGGSIANAKYIVTAAHCLTTSDRGTAKVSPKNLKVIFGVDEIWTLRSLVSQSTPHENIREVKRVTIHPDYRGRIRYDIGLIELKLALKYSENVLPVVLDDSGIGYWTGSSEAQIAGFGRTESGLSSDQLLAVTPYIRSAWFCSWKHGKKGSFMSNICYTYEEGKGTCYGDSGSGIVVKKGKNNYLLIGVTSSVETGKCGKSVDIGMRVAHFKEWIEDHTSVW